MAALRIDVDGVELATVNLEGMHLMHVSVHSSLHEEAATQLEVHGGTYGDTTATDGHRIWVNDKHLLPGQLVRVSFVESAAQFDQGQTMDELFPNREEPAEEYDFTMTDARAAELRARPKLRESFSANVVTSSGTECRVGSSPKNDQFTFMILWNNTRPEQARLSVRTYCFEDVIKRQRGNDHLQGTLATGEFATCVVVA